MLNAERFRNEILEAMNSKNELSLQETNGFLLNKYSNEFKPCSEDEYSDCDNCLFDDEDLTHSCEYHRTKWLLSECKEPIKLTRFERDILMFAFKSGYYYITRDECGVVKVHKEKPNMNCNEMIGFNWGFGKTMHLFDGLFDFVKWEGWEKSKPTSIIDILENCEVVEND